MDRIHQAPQASDSLGITLDPAETIRNPAMSGDLRLPPKVVAEKSLGPNALGGLAG
jgi:hypothetical protein